MVGAGGGKREISGTMMGSFQNCGNCGLKSQRDPAAEKIGESVVQGLSTILWFLFVFFILKCLEFRSLGKGRGNMFLVCLENVTGLPSSSQVSERTRETERPGGWLGESPCPTLGRIVLFWRKASLPSVVFTVSCAF